MRVESYEISVWWREKDPKKIIIDYSYGNNHNLVILVRIAFSLKTLGLFNLSNIYYECPELLL